MSASVTLHGPFDASARLVKAGQFVDDPFISLDISTKGASVTLIAVDPSALEALSAALGEARVLLASIQPAFLPMADAITPDTIPPAAPVVAGYMPTGTGWPVTR